MDMERDHYEDVAFFTSRLGVLWFVILASGLLLFPFIASNYLKTYYIYVANCIAVNIIAAIGLNLLVGCTGQISLGHAGFFAVGAYATAALTGKLGAPFLPSLLIAASISALLGFLLGLPALRLEGPYLSIATLGFGLTITQIIGKIQYLGARQGLHAPDLVVGPFNLNSDAEKYYLFAAMAFAACLFARNLMKTRVGRAFIAIRDSDVAASTMGVNLMIYKTLAFAVSAFFAGLAGGLYAFVLGYIQPDTFNLLMSIMFLAMIVVGGLGSISGAVAGAVLLTWLDLTLRNVLDVPVLGDWLKSLSQSYFSITGVSNIQYIVFGAIMVLIMLFEPLGLHGIWLRARRYWKVRSNRGRIG
ncbi:inner-membrane translocator [Desulfatibacillum aliphaticivorans]|uniref:Inner-membrane translocator n=1 Tax=Desulfatibacillum aliphaticivorans TaxID=218208 RepID=B8FBY7_DESAL|nr:branched-chain amino acid ABC transporter permease [Desulfatibacillum aliphaticivorans]ACL05192.1 inner-membrane translocator [Desulfatibacillum aliphaticivorans]